MIDGRSLEVPIGTVDVWQLLPTPRWPIMRVIARQFVEQVALHHHMRSLLDSHDWSVVRVVQHPEAHHVYDVFGIPAARR